VALDAVLPQCSLDGPDGPELVAGGIDAPVLDELGEQVDGVFE